MSGGAMSCSWSVMASLCPLHILSAAPLQPSPRRLHLSTTRNSITIIAITVFCIKYVVVSRPSFKLAGYRSRPNRDFKQTGTTSSVAALSATRYVLLTDMQQSQWTLRSLQGPRGLYPSSPWLPSVHSQHLHQSCMSKCFTPSYAPVIACLLPSLSFLVDCLSKRHVIPLHMIFFAS
ncbi:uncharacterized protein EKO05_0002596 [Ascochyta rabiei]|uniref:uncharacterized protein n=1 Tax=Didymella rabiei TaxID=5454 RepID=UPI0021FF71AE|nr:uncharacterized protein EKO05_0002596 [Ascochyta rabiei]UPX12018.1 hypothetical protein EKO05_0002596 [Ascochyta rabiei]